MDYHVGKYFGVSKERELEIAEKLKEMLLSGTPPVDVEKWIAENIKDTGEAYVAGFVLCYHIITMRMEEENEVRKEFWNFLLGIKGPILDPYAPPYPIQLIEQVVFGKNRYEKYLKAMKEYEKFKQKKDFSPEVG